ncbi:hypothetical protein CRG98_042569 [Punica granatum]|uniref:HSF-type DNA-binding domain-containing protein n=1 Tax=Punica granatum TaxID=22663 RepID=A0A2I0I0N3_PUNGR|nr:hypothetical protein CRG98_042569 [Punica granatum]
MEPAAAGGGGGGPAPFLLKTYEMVDDSATDEIVSWSPRKNSFVVWNPPEFARVLLPTYFKHNNFSSFIRQLNTYMINDYGRIAMLENPMTQSDGIFMVQNEFDLADKGFRKIDPERWEFANEDFVKDQKHLLKNIHRRKPIHSHSQPQGTTLDSERATCDEEIDRLTHEKSTLQAKLSKLKNQQSMGKVQIEELTDRVGKMEQRQDELLAFIEKAIQNPTFIEHLARRIESFDLSAYNKKRRLPRIENTLQPAVENSVDNLSSSRPESGNIYHQDFTDKLRLELSPAVSDINLVSHSTQSSNEGGSPQRIILEGDPRETQTPQRQGGILFTPEPLELSDTGTSFTFKMDSSLHQKSPIGEGPRNLSPREEGENSISCHLNLTLASSPLQVEKPTPVKESGLGVSSKSRNHAGNECPKNNNQGSGPPRGRVNDVFWEQFLTERPGSLDNEEASSNYRTNPYDEQDDRRSGQGVSKNAKNMERLSL